MLTEHYHSLETARQRVDDLRRGRWHAWRVFSPDRQVQVGAIPGQNGLMCRCGEPVWVQVHPYDQLPRITVHISCALCGLNLLRVYDIECCAAMRWRLQELGPWATTVWSPEQQASMLIIDEWHRLVRA